MRLTYKSNKEVIHITETPNDADVEFDIRIMNEQNWAKMKELQKKFEEDKVYTDVMFYAYENHHYQVIVRKDSYVDFIVSLLKHQLIERAEWS
jgi:hypothetical protein